MGFGGSLSSIARNNQEAEAARRRREAELAARREREAKARKAQAAARKRAGEITGKPARRADVFSVKQGIDSNFTKARFLGGDANQRQDVCPTGYTDPVKQPEKKEEKKHWWETVTDPVADKVDGLIDAGENVVDAGVKLGSGALHLSEDIIRTGGGIAFGATEAVIDAGSKTIDFAGDVAGDVSREAVHLLQVAAENGLKLGAKALGALHNVALDQIESALDLGYKIRTLGVGDSFSFGGEANVDAKYDGSVAGEISVTATEDGYTVSGEVSAGIGLSMSGEKADVGGKIGLEGNVEFKFDNPEDAKRAALILASGGAAALAPVPLNLALLPNPGELDFLQKNISSVQVAGTLSGEVDAKLNEGFAEVGVSAGAEVSSGYRVEFENGEPSALVRTTELSGSVGGKLGLNFVNEKIGKLGDDKLKAALQQSSEVKGVITVETRIPLDDADAGDVLNFLHGSTNPLIAPLSNNAETSIKGEIEVDLGASGVKAEVEVEGLSVEAARKIAHSPSLSGLGDTLHDAGIKASGSVSSFTDDGPEGKIGVHVGRFGIDVGAHAIHRDVIVLDGFGGKEPHTYGIFGNGISNPIGFGGPLILFP